MASPGFRTIAISLSWLLIAGCSNKHHQEYDEQLKTCSAAEINGVLITAAESCGKALVIASENDFLPDDISDLSFRLGRIERQRGRFAEAETLLRASLEHESINGEVSGEVSRLIELSLCLAGQDRWDEGADLLRRAEPNLHSLQGDDRGSAANVIRGFAAHFNRSGDSDTADQFTALATGLDAG